jgi:rubrerythrin
MLGIKKFFRKKEDFICQNCNFKVKGTGYTNHCPECLFSQHVDNNPGDRQNQCHGLMKPIDLEIKNGKYHIIHQCQKCGIKKKNKSSKNDDFNKLINVSKK